MSLVVDASVVVAVLLDTGPIGMWAEQLLESETLAAPHLMPVEVGNVLRRRTLAGAVPVEVASLAHRDLLGIRCELFPYGPFAERVWELRANLTSYDAWYVAVAEALDAPLATIDERLATAPGPRCEFSTPP